jgi:PAS domain S-box-containing protein
MQFATMTPPKNINSYSFPNAVIDVAGDGRIIGWDKNAEQIFGYAPREIIGSPLLSLLSEKAGASRKIAAAIRQGKRLPYCEAFCKKKDGATAKFAFAVLPVKEGARQAAACVIVYDIDSKGELEKVQNDFISIAAHQLRTPLTAIKWTLEIFMEDKILTPTQRERLNDIYVSNERLINLVNSLLNVSRIQAGTRIANKQKINIKEIVRASIRLLSPNARKKRQKITLKIKTQRSNAVADPLLLNEAFSNVLSNAIAYGPDGGEITVVLRVEGANCLISTHNDGPIIPESARPKLFTRFYRGETERRLKPSGTGLGLFIAKAAVEANGGKIWYESHPGKGTIFTFTTPLLSYNHDYPNSGGRRNPGKGSQRKV